MASNQSGVDFTVIDELNFDNSTLRPSLHSNPNPAGEPLDTVHIVSEDQFTGPNSAYMSGQVSGVMTPMRQSTMVYSGTQHVQNSMVVDENFNPIEVKPEKKTPWWLKLIYVLLVIILCVALYEGIFYLVIYIRITNNNEELIIRYCEELRHVLPSTVGSVERVVFMNGCCSNSPYLKELSLTSYKKCKSVQFAENTFPYVMKVVATDMPLLTSFIVGTGSFSKDVEYVYLFQHLLILTPLPSSTV